MHAKYSVNRYKCLFRMMFSMRSTYMDGIPKKMFHHLEGLINNSAIRNMDVTLADSQQHAHCKHITIISSSVKLQ